MPILSKIDVQINGQPLKSFQRISVNQNLYGIDSFEITCRLDALERPDGFVLENTKEFLGASIVIQTSLSINETEVDGLIFKGFITEVQGSRSSMSDFDSITISGGSSEIVMNRKPTNKVFIDLSLEDIVNEVVKPYGLSTTISPRNSQRFPYVVQYEESDLEFLKRLSIHYGEWFFFDGQQIVFGEMTPVEKNLNLGTNLQDLNYELRVNPVKFSLLSVDPLKRDVYEYNHGSNKTESNLNLYGKHALDKSKKLYSESGKDYYEHLCCDETKYRKGLDDVGELKEVSDAINLSDISGSSFAGFLCSGMKVKITCPDKDGNKVDYGKYLITSVQHSLDNTLAYKNTFAAIPAETKIPENTDPYFVKTTSHQIGLVSDNEDPEKLGRVKISFWWMEGRESTPWIKVASPYVSNDAGFYFVPAIGSRVIVGFEDGDVEKPYCLGTLFDKEVPPDSSWTGNHDADNAKKQVIRTQSGQTIEFTDESGSEQIKIYDTEGKNEVTLDSAKGEISIRADKKISIQAKDIEIKADNKLLLEGSKELEEKGMNINVTANAALKAQGSGSVDISSTGIATLKGSMLKLN